ncbi:hypothetical protein A3F03_02975 [Candidatus Roizmanbacteria bacterium RIFCSPHIGHO2_12_FULL_41_11]|uniref:Glycosyltransferase 2-like domain-containing protein n=3 Tax=Candidatus Roizmaniibacteriota TaxID=1752723 RepID=A0A1F7JRG1_9BACT|nr:MAG: hypothetical protein A3F03_02975 [Candidatus Roizmanbacteria bacterium RIFCSPHIGHO2_12_FULL_41_11]OGK51913.1 MAG: hypothetical protein A2966_00855 [Candidatus Roizmanbacteria bacterium RIFCSPLOWO2_01_FULL_41_22]OGK58220.1 MAG: hypothetical protein A3H86_00305 [Candidatus Roizmanbacteria bacterium RIFCSPLOWO2_02_FULL_41_9]
MTKKLSSSPLYIALGERLVPISTWILITLPIWLSPFHPAMVAYFIIAFDLYFLYKALSTAYHSAISYKNILIAQNVAFGKKIKTLTQATKIQHFIIIPNYKEPLYKIEETIQTIVESDYPYKNLYLVLAFERREKEALEKEKKLINKFRAYFRDILVTYHEIQEGEVPGKASNQAYSARIIESYCQAKNYLLEEVLITICDADSKLPVNYFSYLTHEYLKDKHRQYHFYWAPVLLYNNFWKLPFFVRMQATISSILRLAFLSNKDYLIHISTYSTSLWLLQKINYWDVDIIPEDWHIYFQAYFKFGVKVKTLPLYTIITGDAVYSGHLLKTLINRYEQEKRWAWGVTDVAYAWNHLFTTPHIPFWEKMKKIIFLAENHLLWPTSFFILTISASIPPLINPLFKRTVMGFLLPQLSAFILTLSTLMLIVYMYLDMKLRHKVKVGTRLVYLPFIFIQWYLLPIVSFLLSSLPALEAHTRLLFGKKITYKVTEKV